MKNWNNELSRELTGTVLRIFPSEVCSIESVRGYRVFEMLYDELDERLFGRVLDKLIERLELKG